MTSARSLVIDDLDLQPSISVALVVAREVIMARNTSRQGEVRKRGRVRENEKETAKLQRVTTRPGRSRIRCLGLWMRMVCIHSGRDRSAENKGFGVA